MSDDCLAPATVSLPAVLDLQAADPLRAELLALRGRPLELDASQVTRLGGLCLQVLLSACATWDSDGAQFCVEQPSDAFLDQMAAFGTSDLYTQPEGGRP